MKLTRRSFLKKSGIAAAMWPLADFARGEDFNSIQTIVERFPSITSQKVHSVCSLCQSRCLIDCHVADGRLLKIDGNSNDTLTDGRICSRGIAASKMLYDPDRLKFPLKRIGRRGEGKWARISWGEAIDTIVNNIEKPLSKFGPDSLALFHNGPSSQFIRELFEEIGCEQINNSTWQSCQANNDLAHSLTFGKDADVAMIDFDKAKCIVLIGAHFGENLQVSALRKILKAKENGAKLIVIDPRFSAIASKADYHLMIRPATDTALLLGWLKYIIEQGLHAPLNSNELPGLNETRARLAQYDLQYVAQITDLSVFDLRDTAKAIAEAAPSISIYSGQNSSRYGNDVQRLRAQNMLIALLGGWRIRKTARKEYGAKPAIFPDRKKFDSAIFQKILAGEIKTIGCWGQNPFQSSANPYRVMSAFEQADFVFTCDIFPVETSLYSDIIIPEASFLERTDIVEIYESEDQLLASVRQPAVEPIFEAKDPYWIVKQLSSRLGKGNKFNFNSVADRLNSELNQLGASLFELKQNGVTRLASFEDDYSNYEDQVNLEIFSGQIEAAREIPMLDFEPVSLPPEGYARLLTGRSPVISGSYSINNPWLTHEMSENEIWLNDKIAQRLGIADGERLFIENQDGIRSLKKVLVKVTPGIRVDCLYLAHGFGCNSPFMKNGFNLGISDNSMITRTVPDNISGIRGTFVNFVRFLKDGKALNIPIVDNPPDVLKNTRKWWFDSFGCLESGNLRRKYV